MTNAKPQSFDLEWLTLREPVDHAAQNANILDGVLRYFAPAKTLDIIDLGAGTGSCLRKLAPLLAQDQRWRLVDGDANLLGVASDLCAPALTGRSVIVSTHAENLDLCLARCLDGPADLVTLAAFLDLASSRFVENLVQTIAARSLPVYATLNYSGVEHWQPAHWLDAQVQDAFLIHQRGDKGFGPALGPDAANSFSRALKSRGYSVSVGASDWRLDLRHAALMSRLAEGVAKAVAETGQVSPADLAIWLHARKQSHAAVIGHVDIFATPFA